MNGSRFTSRTYDAPATDLCFECGGGYRHEAGCQLSKAGGAVERGGRYIVRSALGDYWLGATADGPFTEFYATPGEALAAAVRTWAVGHVVVAADVNTYVSDKPAT